MTEPPVLAESSPSSFADPSERCVIIDANMCQSAKSIGINRGIVHDRTEQNLPTFVISNGADSKDKNGPRKKLYKIVATGKMKITRVELPSGQSAFISHNVGPKIHEAVRRFTKEDTSLRTVELLNQILLKYTWKASERANQAMAQSKATGSCLAPAGGSSTETSEVLVQCEPPGVAQSFTGPTSVSVSQRLPDSTTATATIGKDPPPGLCPVATTPVSEDPTPSYPTDARERQKKREKSDKEKGIVRVVNKVKKHVEDHYDDCGESVDCLIKELKKMDPSEEVFLTHVEPQGLELPCLEVPNFTESCFFTGRVPIQPEDPRYVPCDNIKQLTAFLSEMQSPVTFLDLTCEGQVKTCSVYGDSQPIYCVSPVIILLMSPILSLSIKNFLFIFYCLRLYLHLFPII